MKINANHVAGTILSLFGSMVFVYSLTLRFGTLNSLGPGFFPTFIGIILFLLGIGIFFSRKKEFFLLKKQEVKMTGWIMLSIFCFAFALDILGIILACVITILLICYATKQQSVKDILGLTFILTSISVFVFWYLLELKIKLFLF